MSVEIRQYIPSFIETRAQRKSAIVETPADLDRVDWIRRWRQNTGHTFTRWMQSVDPRLLIAVYDEGNYWWVVGFMSGELPGLEEWSSPFAAS
jgi:hypothetical protein